MEEEKEQDLSHIHWQWPEAIAANPARSLATPDLAMDYFAFSPFWHAQSNNSVLRTQNIATPGYGSAQERIDLLAMTSGFEYVVAHARPPELFVIHRRPVTGKGARGPPTHAYFILRDRVYMAPNLYDVVRTRVGNATGLLERTLGRLEEARPPANPRAARVWIAGERKEKEGDGEGDEKEREEGKEKEDKRETKEAKTDDAAPNWHLFNALAATRAALPGLQSLASSARPKHDTAAEARTLEVLAASSVRPNAPNRHPSPATHGFAPLSPLVGTPSFSPRPRLGSFVAGLSRPASTLAPSVPADSPMV